MKPDLAELRDYAEGTCDEGGACIVGPHALLALITIAEAAEALCRVNINAPVTEYMALRHALDSVRVPRLRVVL